MHTITAPTGDTLAVAGHTELGEHSVFWQRREWIVLALLALVAIAVYANSLWNGFAFDDDYIILHNTRVHQLKDLGVIWGTPYWPSYGSELGLYRPLAIFAYALEWAAADGQPWIFHAVNVALHALITGLVFLLLRTFVSTVPAALGSLVFAVHPVHTEVVANGVGQAELLAAAGMVGACLIYARRPADSSRVGWGRLLAVVALYFTTLFAKEGAITLPALLVLLDVAHRRVTLSRAQVLTYLRNVWLLLFLLAAAAVMYLSIRTDVLGSISGLDAGPGLPFLREEHRVLSALRAWPEYVRLLFFPKDLSADYAPAVILPVESITPMALLGALILACTVALALLAPLRPQAGFAAGWFFITILTVSNLLFPIGVVVAERTLYTPSVAVAALVAFGWHALQQQWPAAKQRLGLGVLLMLVGLMSVRTFVRNADWKSTKAVLLSIVRDHPEAYRSAWLMATHYWQQGDIGRSTFYWEAALRLWPRDSQLLTEVANFYIGRRNWPRATVLLEQARAIHPWVWRTQELLAFTYAHSGKPTLAIVSANEAIRFGGERSGLYAIKARAYEELGNQPMAVGAWRAATQSGRTSRWVYHGMLARALARFGDQPGALAALESATRAHAREARAVSVLTSLAAEIRAGCHQAPAGAGCSDVMADWALSGDPLVPQKVTNSQNLPGSGPTDGLKNAADLPR